MQVDADEIAGWKRYLDDVRSFSSSTEYELLEQAAWDRLRAHLAAIGKPLVRRKGKVTV